VQNNTRLTGSREKIEMTPIMFYNVNINVVKSINFWFALRESYAMTYWSLWSLITTKSTWANWKFYAFGILMLLILTVVPFADAFLYKQRAIKMYFDDEENAWPVFNQKNIEYIKFMAPLYGGNINSRPILRSES
jgi:hypothetical protein